MRTFYIISVSLLMLCCSSRHNSEVIKNDIPNLSVGDSLSITVEAQEDQLKYIGFIDRFYFSDENEVYVELYFIQDEIDSDEYENIISLSDSLV